MIDGTIERAHPSDALGVPVSSEKLAFVGLALAAMWQWMVEAPKPLFRHLRKRRAEATQSQGTHRDVEEDSHHLWRSHL